MKHTKGPWTACHNGSCSCKQIWGDDHPIAEVVSGDWGDDYPAIRLTGSSIDAKAEAYMAQITYGTIPEDTAKANALLIASAPCLVSALEDLLELHEDEPDRPAVAYARSIIAKAKGQGGE